MRLQQIYEGKEVYGHQLTAHVDKRVLLKVFQGKRTKFRKEDLKNPINLSKEEAKQYIYKKYGNDIKFISEPEVKEVILLMKIMDRLAMHIKLHLRLPHQTMYLELI